MNYNNEPVSLISPQLPLDQVLTQLAAQIHADPADLIKYAAEDELGGYHWNESYRTFPSGSLWQVEGKMLYALVRWLKPETVVEIGGWAGGSASHLAAAVIANGSGRVISVDSGVGGQEHGHLLTSKFREVVKLVKADGVEWLKEQPEKSIDFIFEDADHSADLVRRIMEVALTRIKGGGIIANHDAAHDFAYVGGGVVIGSGVGAAVRDGLFAAHAHFQPYLAHPSDCGLAITVAPKDFSVDLTKLNPPTEPVRVLPQFDGMNSDAGQGVLTETPSHQINHPSQQVGNAHIESMSEPPPISEPIKDQEKAADQTPAERPARTPRSKTSKSDKASKT